MFTKHKDVLTHFFNSPEEIADWFRRKDTELGDERRRRD